MKPDIMLFASVQEAEKAAKTPADDPADDGDNRARPAEWFAGGEPDANTLSALIYGYTEAVNSKRKPSIYKWEDVAIKKICLSVPYQPGIVPHTTVTCFIVSAHMDGGVRYYLTYDGWKSVHHCTFPEWWPQEWDKGKGHRFP